MAQQVKSGHNKLNKAYGFSAEQAAKQKSKWDQVQYKQVCEWMNKVLGSKVLDGNKGSDHMQQTLANGVILCEFINKIKPNSVGKKAIKQMKGHNIFDVQRISLFITKAKELGLPDHSSFSAPDLRDNNNMTQVLIGLYTFGRECHNKKIAQGGIVAKANKGNGAWSLK